jgi:hypothetical protein
MNLLAIAKAKKTKLESMNCVKINATLSALNEVVIAENGVIINSSDLIKFENGIAYVTGIYASVTIGVMSACRQNKIIK